MANDFSVQKDLSYCGHRRAVLHKSNCGFRVAVPLVNTLSQYCLDKDC